MLTEIALAPVAVLAGTFLGALFFGGLWWTVRRGMTSRNPALWFSMSLVLRAGVSLAGFYTVSLFGWRSLLLCLLGFVVARITITRRAARWGRAPHAP